MQTWDTEQGLGCVPTFHLFLKVELGQANDPRYYSLDPTSTVRESLAGKTIIEFPTVYVVLPQDVAKFPLKQSLIEDVSHPSEPQSTSQQSHQAQTQLVPEPGSHSYGMHTQ